MPKLLVVDDEPSVLFSIEQVFEEDSVELLTARTPQAGLKLAHEETPDVILLDLMLGEESGLDVLHKLRESASQSLVVFITGQGNSDTAIEAMKGGAHDYLVKPLDRDHLRRVVSQAMEISRLMHAPKIVPRDSDIQRPHDQFIGRSAAIQTICKKIGRVAAQDVNVLILGESGTGKELVARAIYQHSHRNGAAFRAINCAAIPESLLESALFGHERGAFTGAEQRRIGKFEQCHQGTLLLDEIGDMAPETQAKMLRLIEEKEFERVGGSERIASDVRILAATNQDLEARIEEGRFRKDLYYRLRGVAIHLPPLRERREDVPELAHYFLFRSNPELGTAVQAIASETMDYLLQYDWPGNIRELQSVIRESLLRASGSVLLPEFLPPELLSEDDAGDEDAGPAGVFEDLDWQALPRFVEQRVACGGEDVYRQALEHFDRLLIARGMREAEGNQARASKVLGISRVTLRAKLRAIGLTVEKVLADRDNHREDTC